MDFKGLSSAVLLGVTAESFACGNIFEKQIEVVIVNCTVYRMFLD